MTLALVLGTFMSGWCDSQPNIIPAPLKMVKGEGFMRLNVASPRSVLEQAMKQLVEAYNQL